MYLHTTALFLNDDLMENKYALSKFNFTYEQIYIENNIKFIFEKDDEFNKPKYENEIYIKKIYMSYIYRLTKALNSIGIYNYTERTFELMVGHWLKRYLSNTYHKFLIIKKTLYYYPNIKVFDYKENEKILINTGSDFIFFSNSSLYNHKNYLNIIKYLNPSIEVNVINRKLIINREIEKKVNINLLNKIITKLSSKLNKKIYIKNTYLNKKSLIYFCIKKMCIPAPNNYVQVKSYAFNSDLREKIKLSENLDLDDFHNFIDSQILFEIPTCYVEGMNDLVENSKIIYPKKVDVVFTSNSFDTDEQFKAWVCLQISNGSKYVVGQHGAGYGTSKYFKTYWEPEISTCDKFISWGWTTKSVNKIRPHFNYKISNFKIKRTLTEDSKLSPLIILPCLNNMIVHWDDTENHLLLMESLVKLTSSFDCNKIEKGVIRLHQDYSRFYFNDKDFLLGKINNDFFQIDNGKSKLSELIAHTNITIFFYDSTGFIEHLAQNLHCFLYLPDGLNSIDDEAKVHYKVLIEANIIHLNIESLILFIKKNSNLNDWWNSAFVCDAKINFTSRYSRFTFNNYNLVNEFNF
jgi:putative transferase (TIGR04331 family)